MYTNTGDVPLPAIDDVAADVTPEERAQVTLLPTPVIVEVR
jgi:hypothetical protein